MDSSSNLAFPDNENGTAPKGRGLAVSPLLFPFLRTAPGTWWVLSGI